jgi:hypothetical protein
MSNTSPSLSAIFARTRYEAILAGSGPRRDGLLASAFHEAVSQNVFVRDVPVDFRNFALNKEEHQSFFDCLDLSCVTPGWRILGAVVQAGGFVWIVCIDGTMPTAKQIGVWEFGYRFEESGYARDWVPSGQGSIAFRFNEEVYAPEVLGIELAKRLAKISAARALSSPEN